MTEEVEIGALQLATDVCCVASTGGLGLELKSKKNFCINK